MHLVNVSRIPAVCLLGLDALDLRVAMIVAKATFRFDDHGRTALVGDGPPVRVRDEDTALGCLPAETVPRRGPGFEVLLLGRAHAPGGVRCRTMNVGLAVGDRVATMLVLGARRWHGGAPAGKPSEPEPFEALPLIWENAFGGTARVWLDPNRAIELQHPLNRRGRGFDVAPALARLAKQGDAPAGFPISEGVRGLPSLERTDQLIRWWSDAPAPICWATIPRDIGFSTLASRERTGDREADFDRVYERAHPDWVIPVPTAGARVALAGVRAEGEVAFELPRLRVVADLETPSSAGRTRRMELAPRSLLIQPEASTFSIVYRKLFAFEQPRRGLGGAVRLRIEHGWARDASVVE